MNERDLHMQSHYRRIASVKGRIDSAMPLSMVKDVKRKDSLMKKSLLDSSEGRMTDTDNNKDGTTNFRHEEVIYKGCGLHSARQPSHRWELYHTQTGRDVSMLKEIKSKRQLKVRTAQMPWKPSLNTNSRTDHWTLYQSLQAKPSTVHVLNKDVTDEKQTKFGESEVVGDEDRGTRPYRNRFELSERNEYLKQSIAESEKEHQYLHFLSEVVSNILSGGSYSDRHIESVFTSHIARNKHHLREDVMLAKISELRKQLGMNSS